MPKEEIIGGIKNAMERGASFEQAVQSFINAGYNPEEVKQAASQINQGAATPIMEGQAPPAQPTPTQPALAPEGKDKKVAKVLKSISGAAPVKKESKRFLIILAIIFLIIVIGIIIFFILFPGIIDELLKLIT